MSFVIEIQVLLILILSSVYAFSVPIVQIILIQFDLIFGQQISNFFLNIIFLNPMIQSV